MSAGTDLMILESMFCDNEQDPEVLAEYFRRFAHTLRSVLRQELPEDLELLVTIYMSSDKRRWIDHAWSIIDETELPPRMVVRIWEYAHPPEGYPAGQGVDRLKSPNKHAPYRDRLFQDAQLYVDHSVYRTVIRVAVDDDDLWLPQHAAELHRIASEGHRLFPEAKVLALGPVNCLVGYLTPDGVEVDVVSLRRTLTGDKFYSVEHPSVQDLATLSPWSAPEILDDEMAARLAERGITLRYVKGNRPGFVYLRWGRNLSNYRKDFHVAHTFGTFRTGGVDELAAVGSEALPEVEPELEFGTFGQNLLVRAARAADGSVRYSTNFESLRLPGAEICFYLLQDGRRVGVRAYGRTGSGVFPDAPENATVKAFVRNEGGIFLREESAPT
ncbi:hypothetical protein ACH9EU_05415 [Kocuria sp. M1R5S2]|uniref:hypothetical protein n=1 Tax=Kocuria rhizosphaerae TaxID=3376285 RepID=UPI0037B667E1